MEITADDDFPEDQLRQIWKEHGYDLRLIHAATASAIPGDKMWHVVNDCPLHLLLVEFSEKLVNGEMTKKDICPLHQRHTFLHDHHQIKSYRTLHFLCMYLLPRL